MTACLYEYLCVGLCMTLHVTVCMCVYAPREDFVFLHADFLYLSVYGEHKHTLHNLKIFPAFLDHIGLPTYLPNQLLC